MKCKGLRLKQAMLPSGCKMSIYVAYDHISQVYRLRKVFLVHNHSVGPEEFTTYRLIPSCVAMNVP